MTVSLPSWHPHSFARRRDALRDRQIITRAARRWFEERGFDEVDTPALQVCPGFEPHIHLFSTLLESPRADEAPRQRFLHTSPEISMKKLLVAGIPRLFQLCHVWRNQEDSDTHLPEFTMLEWYRAHEGLPALMHDCESMIRAVAAALTPARTHVAWRGVVCNLAAPWQILSVPDAFHRYAGIDLLATAPDPHAPDRALLATAAARADVRCDADDTWEDIVFRIMFQCIEPHLGRDAPTFLTDYPVSMAGLARANPKDPRLAARFELYICGLELANAFDELTDPVQQHARATADLAYKAQRYGTRVPLDDDFINALTYGMPDSAGIALGFDRLVMLLTGQSRVRDVVWLHD